MKQGLLEILSIALIYCGTVFGAGFASGQEVVSFFSTHALHGVVVSVFAGFLFSFFGYLVCAQAKTHALQSATDYFRFLFSKRVSVLLSLLCTAFLVVSFCIMIAGCGTLFYEQFSLRPVVGSLVSLCICYRIMRQRVGGLAQLNGIVTPLMFFGVVVLCALVLAQTPEFTQVQKGKLTEASVSGVLYISYNMVSAVAVLVPCAAIATTRRRAAWGGAIGGLLVAVPLVLLAFTLVMHPSVQKEQMPFFSLICALRPGLKPICSAILYGAMLTTAASSGVSVVTQAPQKISKIYALLLCFLALVASFVPFDVLVKTMYTLFGLCGILLISSSLPIAGFVI